MDPFGIFFAVVRLAVAAGVGYLAFALIYGSEKSSVVKRSGTVRKGLMAAVPVGLLTLAMTFYPLQVCGGLLFLLLLFVVLLRIRAPAPMAYPETRNPKKGK